MAWRGQSRFSLLFLVLCSVLCISICAGVLAAAASNPPGLGKSRHLGSSRKKLIERKQSVQDELLFPPLKAYKTNAELIAAMKSFAQRCSNVTRLYTIGRSVHGVPLMVLEISDFPGQFEPEPAFKYVGNMHGNEPSGRELTLYLAEWLCANYLKDDLATLIVQNVHLHLLPSMNPDGFERKTRNNANDVDLNRDFPDQFFPQNNNLSQRQPETRAIMQWIDNTQFAASASLHEGALVASYGWDGTLTGRTGYAECPDDGGFRYMASLYAQLNPSMKKSQEFPGGVTNGAAWYPLYGGMQDWNYISGNCFEITLEMTDGKWPNISKIAGLWRQHKSSMLELVASLVKSGVHGRVISSADGRPLPAIISVKGNTHPINASTMFGDYHRILPPGKTYEVTAQLDGFVSRTTTVVLSTTKSTTLDFILDPLPTFEVYVEPHPKLRGSRRTPIVAAQVTLEEKEVISIFSPGPEVAIVPRTTINRRTTSIWNPRKAMEQHDLVSNMTVEHMRVSLAIVVMLGALLYVFVRCRRILRPKYLLRKT